MGNTLAMLCLRYDDAAGRAMAVRIAQKHHAKPAVASAKLREFIRANPNGTLTAP